MGTISFANQSVIDMATVTTMGVSVKETDTPIGFFGTGLKFAVAVLLRTGHTVKLRVDGVWHVLGKREQIIRGEPFDVVTLDGEAVGFTTQLGRNWKVWQAYRELACNARDEGRHLVSSGTLEDDASWGTLIEVSGPEIEDAHGEQGEIFCHGTPIACQAGYVEVIDRPSKYVYYRGVRVHTLQKPSLLTYNIIQSVDLTEDRTLAYSFILPALVASGIAALTSEDTLQRCLTSREENFENKADFSQLAVNMLSEQFLTVSRRMIKNMSFSESARRLIEKIDPSVVQLTSCELSDLEISDLAQAHALCKVIDHDYTHSSPEPMVVSDLGPGVLGCVRGGRILISRGCFSMGLETLTGTLYEEYLHLHRGLDDCSRSMQNHLLNTLARMARS
jgi:hypothetical protein